MLQQVVITNLAYRNKGSTNKEDFWRIFSHATIYLPEHKLMFAILENAVRCAMADFNNSAYIIRESRDWINNTTEEGIYSFQSVCDHLDLSPSYVRRKVKELIENKTSLENLEG